MRSRALALLLVGIACGSEYDVGGGSSAGSASTSGDPTDGGSGSCVECEDGCVDLSSNPENCGACGMSCSDGQACVTGQCVEGCDGSCDTDREICQAGECRCRAGLTPCGDGCVDLDTDADHCGACDSQCPEACGGGMCVPAACTGFPLTCGTACVDPQTDPLHCGACDEACSPTETCADGRCEDGAHGMTWAR